LPPTQIRQVSAGHRSGRGGCRAPRLVRMPATRSVRMVSGRGCSPVCR